MSVTRHLDRDRTIPEEMVGATVPAVRAAAVRAVHHLESLGEAAEWGPHQHVVVVRQQAPAEDIPTVPRRGSVELADDR
jgi:hypothetical protein